MIELPGSVEEVARRLHREGYAHSEAYPIGRWKREGWPTDKKFFDLVDACLKILRSLDDHS
jgi:hypothetical protein